MFFADPVAQIGWPLLLLKRSYNGYSKSRDLKIITLQLVSSELTLLDVAAQRSN